MRAFTHWHDWPWGHERWWRRGKRSRPKHPWTFHPRSGPAWCRPCATST